MVLPLSPFCDVLLCVLIQLLINSAHPSKVYSLLVVMLPSSSDSVTSVTLLSFLLVTFLIPFPVSTASLTLIVLYSLMSSFNSFLTVLHIFAYSIFVRGFLLSIIYTLYRRRWHERRWLHQAFQVQAWAGSVEILECPVTRTSLSALLAGSDGKSSRYGRCQCSCRSCGKVLQCLTVRLGGILLSIIYTLYTARYILHVIYGLLYTARYILPVIHCMLYTASYILHVCLLYNTLVTWIFNSSQFKI